MKLVSIFALLAALTAAALLATAAQAQEQVDVSIVEQNSTGVTGSATVSSVGDGQTEITIALDGLDPDTSHVNHIHDGTGCGEGEYTGIVEGLTNIDADASGAGTATTIVAIDVATIADGGHVLVVHGGATLKEGAFAIACGHIPAMAIPTEVPTQVPPEAGPPPAGTGYSAGDDSPLTIAMGASAAGGIALLGAGWTMRRRVKIVPVASGSGLELLHDPSGGPSARGMSRSIVVLCVAAAAVLLAGGAVIARGLGASKRWG